MLQFSEGFATVSLRRHEGFVTALRVNPTVLHAVSIGSVHHNCGKIRKTVTFPANPYYNHSMKPHLRHVLAIAVFLPSVGQASMSDITCDDSARLAQKLTSVLGVERQGGGLRDPDTLLEVWINSKSGDWMIVQNYTNGTSCVVAMGEHWEGESLAPA